MNDYEDLGKKLTRRFNHGTPEHPATGPNIILSFDFTKDFVDRYGLDSAERLMGSIYARFVLDMFPSFWRLGRVSADDLRAGLERTMGVVRVRDVLVNGIAEDAVLPPGEVFPQFVHLDVRVVKGTGEIPHVPNTPQAMTMDKGEYAKKAAAALDRMLERLGNPKSMRISGAAANKLIDEHYGFSRAKSDDVEKRD